MKKMSLIIGTVSFLLGVVLIFIVALFGVSGVAEGRGYIIRLAFCKITFFQTQNNYNIYIKMEHDASNNTMKGQKT